MTSKTMTILLITFCKTILTGSSANGSSAATADMETNASIYILRAGHMMHLPSRGLERMAKLNTKGMRSVLFVWKKF